MRAGCCKYSNISLVYRFVRVFHCTAQVSLCVLCAPFTFGAPWRYCCTVTACLLLAAYSKLVVHHRRHSCRFERLTASHPLRSPFSTLYLGRVGVGWQRHCRTCRSLLELDSQGTVLFCSFGGRSQLAVQLDHLCWVETFYSAQGE